MSNAVTVPADELAELQRDAARYRWLRDTNPQRPDTMLSTTVLMPNIVGRLWYGLPAKEWDFFRQAVTCEPGAKFDAAIDKAMRKSAPLGGLDAGGRVAAAVDDEQVRPGIDLSKWTVVPIQPTLAMLNAADHKFQSARHSLAGFNARELAYKAMLAAAPPHGVPVAVDPRDHWFAEWQLVLPQDARAAWPGGQHHDGVSGMDHQTL